MGDHFANFSLLFAKKEVYNKNVFNEFPQFILRLSRQEVS